MANYIKRPEPGRFTRTETVVEKIIEKPEEKENPELDINAIAQAVAAAIGNNAPQQVTHVISSDGTIQNDSFDDSKTMDRLADQMLVQRGESAANFDDLGDVKETKIDQKKVDSTIDLLSKLND